MPRNSARAAGFTLIEVVVVLAILALLASLVLSRRPQRSAALDMRAASTEVAAALRLARGRAIAANRPVPVRFDAGAATLRVGADAPRALPPGITLAITAAAEQGPAILFLPDGSATGGRVDLTGEGRRAQIGVDWLTGRVSIADAR